jgi:cytochrome c
MDTFEINKIIGAILGTLLFVMGVGFLAEAIYHPLEGIGPGYALAGGETESGGGTTTPDTPAVSIGTLLASADPAAGQAAAKKCQSCHDFTQGGPNKTGPNLYDVVERPIGSHPGFAYSAGMLERNKNGDIWSYENLNQFITSPKSFVPGTKMTFAGVKDDAERANIIAYLSTLSANPKPFPAPEAPSSGSAEAPNPGEAPTSSEAPPSGEVPQAASSVETPEATSSPVNAPGGAVPEAPSSSAIYSAP